jgi:Sel1 repeat
MISRLRSKCLVAAVGFAWATISGVSIGVAGSPPKKPPSVDIQAVIKSADEAARNDDFIEALRLYRQAAEKGDPRAQYEVGVMVQDGHFEEAVKWWRLAAAQGYAEAEYQLGSIYERGYGVPKDKNESMKWYKLAAAHGYAEAEYKLGMKKRPPKHAAAAPSVPLTTNSVESAYKLCAYFDATKLLSQKCSVSGWHSSVDISLDMAPADARKFCNILPGFFSRWRVAFDRGWRVRIYSPFSGERPIATCDL